MTISKLRKKGWKIINGIGDDIILCEQPQIERYAVLVEVFETTKDPIRLRGIVNRLTDFGAVVAGKADICDCIHVIIEDLESGEFPYWSSVETETVNAIQTAARKASHPDEIREVIDQLDRFWETIY